MRKVDNELLLLLGGLFILLMVASLIGFILSRRKQNDTIANLNARIRTWWVMCTISVSLCWSAQ